jgi:hypothetical protein
MNRRMQFIQDYERKDGDCGAVAHIIVAINLPAGAVEIIMNTNDIWQKFSYYCDACDNDLHLKIKPEIFIKDWLFVS